MSYYLDDFVLVILREDITLYIVNSYFISYIKVIDLLGTPCYNDKDK
jgi:hypothetical protein